MEVTAASSYETMAKLKEEQLKHDSSSSGQASNGRGWSVRTIFGRKKRGGGQSDTTHYVKGTKSIKLDTSTTTTPSVLSSSCEEQTQYEPTITDESNTSLSAAADKSGKSAFKNTGGYPRSTSSLSSPARSRRTTTSFEDNETKQNPNLDTDLNYSFAQLEVEVSADDNANTLKAPMVTPETQRSVARVVFRHAKVAAPFSLADSDTTQANEDEELGTEVGTELIWGQSGEIQVAVDEGSTHVDGKDNLAQNPRSIIDVQGKGPQEKKTPSGVLKKFPALARARGRARTPGKPTTVTANDQQESGAAPGRVVITATIETPEEIQQEVYPVVNDKIGPTTAASSLNTPKSASDSLTWVSHDKDCELHDSRPLKEISFPTPEDGEEATDPVAPVATKPVDNKKTPFKGPAFRPSGLDFTEETKMAVSSDVRDAIFATLLDPEDSKEVAGENEKYSASVKEGHMDEEDSDSPFWRGVEPAKAAETVKTLLASMISSPDANEDEKKDDLFVEAKEEVGEAIPLDEDRRTKSFPNQRSSKEILMDVVRTVSASGRSVAADPSAALDGVTRKLKSAGLDPGRFVTCGSRSNVHEEDDSLFDDATSTIASDPPRGRRPSWAESQRRQMRRAQQRPRRPSRDRLRDDAFEEFPDDQETASFSKEESAGGSSTQRSEEEESDDDETFDDDSTESSGRRISYRRRKERGRHVHRRHRSRQRNSSRRRERPLRRKSSSDVLEELKMDLVETVGDVARVSSTAMTKLLNETIH